MPIRVCLRKKYISKIIIFDNFTAVEIRVALDVLYE